VGRRARTSYAETVFGRSRTTQTTPPAETTTTRSGKGRPTPTRREAEARNRRPVVGSPQVKANATREERKAARAARRELMAEERTKMREAMITGDERHLPARDRGPERRYARDYVDARRNLGEFLLPAAFVVLLLSLFRPTGVLAYLPILALYGMVLVIAVDAFLLRRRVGRLVTEKFGADRARGIPGYAMMRALQMRRTRMPKPQVARGEFPH
jgi:hypothetical protein